MFCCNPGQIARISIVHLVCLEHTGMGGGGVGPSTGGVRL